MKTKKTKKTKALASMAAGAAIVAGALFAAAPANAISRASCGSAYLQINSPATTCWANAGTASVTLYSVVGFSSGNNAGFIMDSARQAWVFPKKYVYSIGKVVTITTVSIS